MALSPEQAKLLLAKNEINLAEKVKGKKTLSPQEKKMLEDIVAAGEGSVIKPWADNQVDLAECLGVERKTIQRWLKIDDNPGAESNGKYNVIAWRKWAASHGRKKGFQDGDDIDTTKAKAEQILLHNELLRNRLAIQRKEWIPKSVARQTYSKLILELKARNYAALVRFVTLSKMAPSTPEGIELLRKEMDEIWKGVTDTKWFTPLQ